MRPHLYCLPILKREAHRQAIVRAAISGNPKYFLGTDSAPHARHTKESACCCGRLLLGARSARALRRGLRGRRRAGSARGIRELPRRRFLWLAAQHAIRSRCAAKPGRSRTSTHSVRSHGRSAAGGRKRALARRDECRSVLPCAEVSQTVAARTVQAGAGRGKSGLRRAGCWVTPRRDKSSARAATKARNRATETSRARSGQH